VVEIVVAQLVSSWDCPGNRKQGTGKRKQATGNWEQGTVEITLEIVAQLVSSWDCPVCEPSTANHNSPAV
jgi:hypothetical protein